jgi:hypothetical protein
MNITALSIGVLVSIIIIVRFKRTRLKSNKYAYTLLLFICPLYYFGFAQYSHDYKALPLELLTSLLFFVIVLLALKSTGFQRLILLSISYLFHGVYNLTHNLYFINIGTPVW